MARLPGWFRKPIPAPAAMAGMRALVADLHLHTVCESALCPNVGDCFSQRTATFMLLGEVCTRRCTFCAVSKGQPRPVDEAEPENVARAVARLGLRHAVITSVTRDDLPDGGAAHFARTIRCIKQASPGITVEVLVPDFRGDERALLAVLEAGPEVLNHNLETVPRLYPEVRPGADYARSLRLLRLARKLRPQTVTKSGLMLGLGESEDELVQVMADLREAGCDLLTLGQYLRPSPAHHPVVRYVPPPEFDHLAGRARRMGFAGVAAAPLVRSSFEAARLYEKAITGVQA